MSTDHPQPRVTDFSNKNLLSWLQKSIRMSSQKEIEPKQEQQSSSQNFSSPESSKQKSRTKIEPYLRVLDHFHKIDPDDPNPKNPYKLINQTTFWYLINGQYFSNDLFKSGRPNEAVQEITRRLNKNPLQLPYRLDRRRIPKNETESLLQFQTEELREKAEDISMWIDYYSRYKRTKQKIQMDYVMGSHQSTPVQDQQFISSTRAIIYNFVSKKIEQQNSFRKVVGTYLRSKKLTKTKKIKKAKKVNLVDYRERMVGLEEKKEENEAKIQNIEKDEEVKIEEEQIELIYGKQHILLDALLQLPLEKVMALLQESIPKYNFPQITPSLIPQPQNPADFVTTLFAEEQQYLQYMKQKNKRKILEEGLVPPQQAQFKSLKGKKQQDVNCQICFSGDYEQDNMIVLCSLCNIAVHQQCIYLEKVPDQNWICEVCEAFGPAGINLPCALCSVTGGGMKRTNAFIKNQNFSIKNHTYQQYSDLCPFNFDKQRYIGQQMKKDKDLQMLYNYFEKETYSKEIPKCHYVWAHYSCIITFPECYFVTEGKQLFGAGIDAVPEHKFNRECQICFSNLGAAIKCREMNCDLFFHAECAKRNKLISQQAEKDKIDYYIYCQEHQPYSLAKILNAKHKKYRQDIKQFAQAIVKSGVVDKSEFRFLNHTQRRQKYISKNWEQWRGKTVEQTRRREQRRQDRMRREKENKERIQQYRKGKHLLLAVIRQLKCMAGMKIELKPEAQGLIVVGIKEPNAQEMRNLLQQRSQFWKRFRKFRKSAKMTERRFSWAIKFHSLLGCKLDNFIKRCYRSNQSSMGVEFVFNNPNISQKTKLMYTQRRQKLRELFGNQMSSSEQRIAKFHYLRQNRQKKNQQNFRMIQMEEENQTQMVKTVSKPEKNKYKKNKEGKKDQKVKQKSSRKYKKVNYGKDVKVEQKQDRILFEISKNAKEVSMKEIKLQDSQDIHKIQELPIQMQHRHPISHILQQSNQKISPQIIQTTKKTDHKKVIEKTASPELRIVPQRKIQQNQTSAKKSQYNEKIEMDYVLQSQSLRERPKRGKTPEEVLYCLCKKPYEKPTNMIQCQSCLEWYHYKCIGYRGSIQVAQKLKFFCAMCLKAQNKITKKKILKDYVYLFKSDSQIYAQNRQYLQEIQGKVQTVKYEKKRIQIPERQLREEIQMQSKSKMLKGKKKNTESIRQKEIKKR